MRKVAIGRIRIIMGVVFCIALLFTGRLYQIQIVHGEAYQERATSQYVHTSTDVYDRGHVYFTTRQGDAVSAASVRGGFVLAVNPTLITDATDAYAALREYLTVPEETFITRATLPDRTYVEIESRVTPEVADEIADLDLTGVMLYRNQWRYYPGDDLAARTIGFVGFTADEAEGLRGRYGLERYYDNVLLRDDQRVSVNFFAELFTNLSSVVFDGEAERKEGNVVTSIEPSVARMLDETLKRTHEEWGSRVTGGIIMSPKTGEIYAINAVPTFNLNDRSSVSAIETFKNPLVENVYELGSIIKPLTMAAGLDAGAVSPGTTYYDSGKLELDTFTIGNYDGRGRGTVDMQEVLNQSLNTGVAFVVDTMGKQRFRDYFLSLQLGSETGVDLPNEAHGLVENLNSPRDIEYATASFGQGIALTPIGATRALAALGNGGYLVTPHLATEIRYEDGTVKQLNYPKGAQVFSADTSEEISRMLTEVVDDALANGDEALPHHTIAAKTGTAQIADAENGGYYDDRFLHSFFGYFPAYDPEFLIFLYTEEPKDVRYASETLTEPFFALSNFLINYYNIPPDR